MYSLGITFRSLEGKNESLVPPAHGIELDMGLVHVFLNCTPRVKWSFQRGTNCRKSSLLGAKKHCGHSGNS
jgi:hypothetical protein